MTSDVDLLRDTDLLYPEHDRSSCSDESPINVEAAGSHGCERCTAIALARGEASEARANRLREEVDSLRSRLEDTTRDKLNAEARAERLAEALRDARRALAFAAQHLPECNEPYERANAALAQEDRND